MKHTEMPVKRPDPSCIWNSFLNSGKRHIFLTGSRGSGKTTLLNCLFPEETIGITTVAYPQKAVYLRDNLTGEAVQVGLFDPSLPGYENRMSVLQDGFNSFGVSTLMRCADSDSQWITIDEIGYLEAQCAPYRCALIDLLNKKQVAAVVRKQDIPFLAKLCNREDAFIVDMDDPFGNIGCVIMASGVSKRFGKNKLMADFNGSPLISYVLDATEGIFSKRVVVTRHADVARLCLERDICTVLHDMPHRNDTVRLGLEALSDVPRCMFVPADQPLLSKETVASLALVSSNMPDCIWRTVYETTPGSPVVFPKCTFNELLNLSEGCGGSVIIKKYPELLRTLNVSNEHELWDVDTPDDLEKINKR